MPKSSPFDEFVARHGSTPRRGVFGLLVHDLGRRIVSGEFAEGDLLPNVDLLVSQLKFSRTPIREALKSLASKGLVEIRTKMGTRVRPRALWHHTDPDIMVWNYEIGPSQEFLGALADLRRALEPEAAVRAAQRATAPEIAAIGVALQAMRETTSTPVTHAKADWAFHQAIFAATHNLMFERLFDVIAIGIFANAITTPKQKISDGYHRSIPYHEHIFEAIKARDSGRAADAVHRLLDTWQPEPNGRVGTHNRKVKR